MFKRIIDLHLDKWRLESHRKPLLLRGARQVGKTVAIRQLGQKFDYFVEINFEQLKEARLLFDKDLIPERLIQALSLIAKTPIIPGKTLLFFDEVQEAPQCIIALRYFYEQMPELHVVAAGSLMEFAIEKVGVPVGRIVMLYMYPMSFMEYLIATGDSLIAQEIWKHINGRAIENVIHEKILDKLGEYLSIGGMPEAVECWVKTKDPLASLKILQQISNTYRQDFEKYAKKSQIKYLELLFRQVPHLIGKEFSYREIHSEYRKRELEPALELLERANIIHVIRRTSGNGIPIGAGVDFKIFKIIYLDIALCQVILGADFSQWFLNPLKNFENRGEIAEGFVGQELICYESPDSKSQLYFWKRLEKNSTAEVDYLLQRNSDIYPIEVKSGHGGALRSLHLFLETHPHTLQGIRFSSQNYSMTEKLDSRLLYAVVSLAHENQRDAINWLLSE
jgi:predicted AAA+ superfamily ATPase